LLETRPNIPTILCTGFSETIDEEDALKMGVRAFLLKPTYRDELLAVIREVMEG
jgi:two-component system cell cycle sensor histidine kinase/response regulator CckA